MKGILYLSILALQFIYVLSSTEECRLCPDCPLDTPGCGNNRPKCNASIVGIKIRNWWQPDLYWICKKSTGIGESRRCGNNLFFQEELGKCVFRYDYVYSCPCNTCGCSKNETNNEQCNPGRSGKPICDKFNVGQDFLNYWDPTTYWRCNKADSEAEILRCPKSTLFDSASEKCIPDDKWVYTSPCSKNE